MTTTTAPIGTLTHMAEVGENEVTGGQAADILGISHTSVRNIARDRLPYRETPGGLARRGRRVYQRSDVERLARELAGDKHP